MQTVGAQWLLVETPDPGVVALVQTAMTLPVMLLALPGGVIADVFDRRWVLFAVQVYVFVVAGSLAGLTIAGLVTPVVLLVFTFALGSARQYSCRRGTPLLPELVPRSELGSATRLEMVGVNFGRSAGPALAGVVIAVSGVPAVFALNALVGDLFRHRLCCCGGVGRPNRRPAENGLCPRCGPVAAMCGTSRWCGGSCSGPSMFIAPGTALWALLPLVASERLGLGPAGYGALFGALGVGAIVAALVVGRVKRHLSTNRCSVRPGSSTHRLWSWSSWSPALWRRWSPWSSPVWPGWR